MYCHSCYEVRNNNQKELISTEHAILNFYISGNNPYKDSEYIAKVCQKFTYI